MVSAVIVYIYKPVCAGFNIIPEDMTVEMIDKNITGNVVLRLKGKINSSDGFVKEYREGGNTYAILGRLVDVEYYYLFRDSSCNKSVLIKTERGPEDYELKSAVYITGIWERHDPGDLAWIRGLSRKPDLDSPVLTGIVKAEDLIKYLNNQSLPAGDDKIILTGVLNIDIDSDNLSFNKKNSAMLLLAVMLFCAGIALLIRKSRLK